MQSSFRSIEKANEELVQIRSELLQLERRVDAVHESLRKAAADLFRSDREALDVTDEGALASRIADTVLSRFLVALPTSGTRKQYIREREAADYMGVKVSTLRAWRTRRSKNGPPFVHVGRMVLYSVKALEEHMQERLVPRRT